MWNAISNFFIWLNSRGDPVRIIALKRLKIKDRLKTLKNTLNDIQEDIRANEDNDVIKFKLERDFSLVLGEYTRLRAELETLT